MKVEIVGITKSLVEGVSTEDFTAYVARIGKVKDNPERLLRFLIKHSHWSPLEHTYLSFKIETSRAIGRELLRHRSFVFQELSQRYEEVMEFEPIELRKQSENNRQSSEEVFNPEIQLSQYEKENVEASWVIEKTLDEIQRVYSSLLEAGVARECARMILPECTRTTIIMTGNIRSWIHFIGLREASNAQKEAQLIATEVREKLIEYLPNVYKVVTNKE